MVIVRLLNKVPVPGWTALMVIMLLVSGAQLLILGIIGEYLWRNFDATRRRPLFIAELALNMVGPPASRQEKEAVEKRGETT